jgi:hypothetical protein
MIRTQMVVVLVNFLTVTREWWNTFRLQEIKNFFSIIIHMSVLCKSSLQDYWSLHTIIHIPYADSVRMCRDRFLALLTML